MRSIQPIIDRIAERVSAHAIPGAPAGSYARWLWQNPAGNRQLGINEYGCADAANILYMIGRFPSDPAVRADYVRTLQSLQDPDSGLFTEETHHTFHTTAHCIAALELFDAKASYPLTAMHPYLEKEALEQLLDRLDWAQNPWTASHQGAGIYAALVLQGEASPEWQNWYFDWLYDQADPETGFWRKGMVKPICNGDSFSGVRKTPSIFPHLACSFHYLFNHEYAHRPLRYPERAVDTCLSIRSNHMWETLGHSISFAEIDWVYYLNRAMRQCHHRFSEGKEALLSFANEYLDYLESLDPETHDGFNDLHTLFGCTCALAELQAALPGELRSDVPLKLVLDRRPFI